MTPPMLPCFFCNQRVATLYFKLPKWPPPLPQETELAMCEPCSKLDPMVKARHIGEHVNNLRKIHNERAIAQQN